MNIHSNIVRKIRLSRLGCYEIKSNERKLFEFIDKNLLGLKTIVLDDHPSFIMYFNNDNKNVFEYKKENGNTMLGVNPLIWEKIKDDFYFTDEGVKILIKNIVENAYNLKHIKPLKVISYYISEAEKSYTLQFGQKDKVNQ